MHISTDSLINFHKQVSKEVVHMPHWETAEWCERIDWRFWQRLKNDYGIELNRPSMGREWVVIDINDEEKALKFKLEWG